MMKMVNQKRFFNILSLVNLNENT